MSPRYRDPDEDFDWLGLILMLLTLGIPGAVAVIFFHPPQKTWQGYGAVCFFFLIGWYVDGEFRNIKRKLRNAEGRMEERLNELTEDIGGKLDEISESINTIREEIATKT
jgi:hypothetical protein